MSRYEGLDTHLKSRVRARDGHRCRWCGRTGVGIDLHHIRYRRGTSDDTYENVISLCRRCHGFVHGEKNAKGERILKRVAQAILWDLVDMPGATGLAVWRQRRRAWALEGKCEHGELQDQCVEDHVIPVQANNQAEER